jgi:hypothetical protein
MSGPDSSDRYFGLFVTLLDATGVRALARHATPPASIPDPSTGRELRIATLDGPSRAICPSCEATADGGFVSFVGDLRLAYACPSCERLVWLQGA